MKIALTINGDARRADVEPRMTLADLLRDQLRLTGTHLGCEHGVCGACTVIVDGAPVRGCLTLAVQADGCTITTVEGLGTPEALSPLQAAFKRCHALQCGFCTPGILMTLHALLSNEPAASEERIKEALGGHACRCTGYLPIVEAACAAQSAYQGGADVAR